MRPLKPSERGEKVGGIDRRRPAMPDELVPILIVMIVCAYLGWRRYLNYQERLAAIQRGSTPSRS